MKISVRLLTVAMLTLTAWCGTAAAERRLSDTEMLAQDYRQRRAIGDDATRHGYRPCRDGAHCNGWYGDSWGGAYGGYGNGAGYGYGYGYGAGYGYGSGGAGWNGVYGNYSQYRVPVPMDYKGVQVNGVSAPAAEALRPAARPVESCPRGFSPSEIKCTDAERRHGCRDIRLDGGLGCVQRSGSARGSGFGISE